MRKRPTPAPDPTRNDVDAALAAMSAEDFREIVRDMLLELDERSHARAINSLISRAARGGSDWAPAAFSDDDVAEALAFAGCDSSAETARWVAALRAVHRRFPALRAELDRALGAS